LNESYILEIKRVLENLDNLRSIKLPEHVSVYDLDSPDRWLIEIFSSRKLVRYSFIKPDCFSICTIGFKIRVEVYKEWYKYAQEYQKIKGIQTILRIIMMVIR